MPNSLQYTPSWLFLRLFAQPAQCQSFPFTSDATPFLSTPSHGLPRISKASPIGTILFRCCSVRLRSQPFLRDAIPCWSMSALSASIPRLYSALRHLAIACRFITFPFQLGAKPLHCADIQLYSGTAPCSSFLVRAQPMRLISSRFRSLAVPGYASADLSSSMQFLRHSCRSSSYALPSAPRCAWLVYAIPPHHFSRPFLCIALLYCSNPLRSASVPHDALPPQIPSRLSSAVAVPFVTLQIRIRS